jgi:hypothetical protein
MLDAILRRCSRLERQERAEDRDIDGRTGREVLAASEFALDFLKKRDSSVNTTINEGDDNEGKYCA